MNTTQLISDKYQFTSCPQHGGWSFTTKYCPTCFTGVTQHVCPWYQSQHIRHRLPRAKVGHVCKQTNLQAEGRRGVRQGVRQDVCKAPESLIEACCWAYIQSTFMLHEAQVDEFERRPCLHVRGGQETGWRQSMPVYWSGKV